MGVWSVDVASIPVLYVNNVVCHIYSIPYSLLAEPVPKKTQYCGPEFLCCQDNTLRFQCDEEQFYRTTFTLPSYRLRYRSSNLAVPVPQVL